jgi:hypothetical protein
MHELPISSSFEFDEVIEWLEGYGYTVTSRIEIQDTTSVVLSAPPELVDVPHTVGVVGDRAGMWAVTQYGLEHEDDCVCDGCREARAEDAALRRVGM